jgi:hypothetical protein
LKISIVAKVIKKSKFYKSEREWEYKLQSFMWKTMKSEMALNEKFDFWNSWKWNCCKLYWIQD